VFSQSFLPFCFLSYPRLRFFRNCFYDKFFLVVWHDHQSFQQCVSFVRVTLVFFPFGCFFFAPVLPAQTAVFVYFSLKFVLFSPPPKHPPPTGDPFFFQPVCHPIEAGSVSSSENPPPESFFSIVPFSPPPPHLLFDPATSQ